MAGVNKVILLGNVGKDPDARTVGSAEIVNLSVATSERWKDKQTGEQRERTEWHKVTVWAKHSVEFVKNYISKGDRVYIEGKIETRKYEAGGQTRYETAVHIRPFGGEIIRLSGDKASNGSPEGGQRRINGDPTYESPW